MLDSLFLPEVQLSCTQVRDTGGLRKHSRLPSTGATNGFTCDFVYENTISKKPSEQWRSIVQNLTHILSWSALS